MCLLIDVAGESLNDSHLGGLEFHVGPKKGWEETGETAVDLTLREPTYVQGAKNFLWAKYLGTLKNLYHPHQPRNWAHGLENAADYVFQQRFAGKKWSAQANCQQYTRELVAHFELPWPEEVAVIGDTCPWAVDWALNYIVSS